MLNIEITFAHFLVSICSTKNLELIQLKILLFQLDGRLSSRWSRGWEIDRTAGCFHRSAHQTQRENSIPCWDNKLFRFAISSKTLAFQTLFSQRWESKTMSALNFLPKGLVPSRQRSGRDARRGGVLPCHVSCHVMLPCCHVSSSLIYSLSVSIWRYLIEYKLAGNDLPCILPPHLKPPSHRSNISEKI